MISPVQGAGRGSAVPLTPAKPAPTRLYIFRLMKNTPFDVKYIRLDVGSATMRVAFAKVYKARLDTDLADHSAGQKKPGLRRVFLNLLAYRQVDYFSALSSVRRLR
jgi:hypothetical protein